MRILITTGIFPPDIGGPATMLEWLSSDLVGAGFSVTVLTYGAPEKKARPFRLISVSRAWPAVMSHLFYAFKTFFLARQADIIYTTDLYSPGFYSMLAAKFWRKKFVVRFAGDSAWETAVNRNITQDDILTFQEKKYNPFIEKRKVQRTKILKSADAIVAVSNFMKELAIKIGAEPQKIQVIYNAVDFSASFPKQEKPLSPTLVFAGRLTPWKGVEMLIRVVAHLKQKYPDIIFEILGEGSELIKLKELAQELNLNPSPHPSPFLKGGGSREGVIANTVIFRCRVSEEETRQIFARSTIFVLNTNYEGLSHTILEVMTVGLPVITTPSGGNPEIVQDGENGLLVPYNDEKSWEEAIDKLLSDEALQEKFSLNAKKTLGKFKWSELIKKTVEVFKNL